MPVCCIGERERGFATHPHPCYTSYDDLVKIMEDGNFNAGTGWNNSHIGYHWGGAAVQGVYAYYFAKHAPKEWSHAVRSHPSPSLP